MTTQAKLPLQMEEALQALVHNLLASEPFLRYQQARSQFEADEQARALLEEFGHRQANLRRAQAQGAVQQEDIEDLRRLQAEVQRNAVIMAYFETQQQAIDLLREINAEISQVLGYNFASLAQRSTC